MFWSKSNFVYQKNQKKNLNACLVFELHDVQTDQSNIFDAIKITGSNSNSNGIVILMESK